MGVTRQGRLCLSGDGCGKVAWMYLSGGGRGLLGDGTARCNMEKGVDNTVSPRVV
jgi:hypothetical protein